jgi:uncharacterized protein with HEPN domain
VPSNDPIARFEDILENITRIEEFTAGMDVETFSRNTQAVYAVKHALLIISEAAKKLLGVGERLCPEVPWPKVRGIGNLLRHEYDRVDVGRLWLVVEGDLTPLKTSVRVALQRLREGKQP